MGDCRVLHSPHGHNGRRRPAQRPGEGEAPSFSTGQRQGSRPARDHPPPTAETTFSWGQAQFGFLAPPGGLRGPGLHLSRARGGWAAASRLPPRARPGTRLATAPLLGNRSPSGAPPRPFWEVGSRPGGPPRRSQSMSLGSKEAERRGLPLGTAPATHGGGGALTCEPREPWGATYPLHRPGRFRTRALFAAKFRAADWGRPTWLTARALSSERAGLSFPEETGGTCKLCHFRCRGSAREPETQRECAPGGLAS